MVYITLWDSWDCVADVTVCKRFTLCWLCGLSGAPLFKCFEMDCIHLISSMLDTCTSEQQSALSNTK